MFHPRRVCRLVLLGCLVVFGLSTLFEKRAVGVDMRHLMELQARAANTSQQCKVPILDPWDPSIISYYSKPDPLVCKRLQPTIARTEEGGWTVFDSSLAKGLSCEMRSITHNEGVSDFSPILGPPVKLDMTKERHEMGSDFVEIKCASSGLLSSTVYTTHLHTVKKRKESVVTKRPFSPSSLAHPSVVMLGFDSMSRSNFIRQMTNTYKLMQSQGFIDMKSHVKVGDNTYANWIAMLTGGRGTSTEEFPANFDEGWDIHFDDFPLVWKNFSQQGYATFFAEDRPDIATFNYLGKLLGFKNQPTDHYFRPYWLAASSSSIWRRSTPFCYDTLPHHVNQLEYLKSFTRAYQSTSHFAWWWTQDMSHDYLNLIGKADGDVESVLKDPSLADSIVIVFGDHGHRTDRIRETVVGRLEARLPFLSIRLPPALKKAYPHLEKTLRLNSERLTSQFDLHATLLDIAKGTFTRPSTATKPLNNHGYSLFQPVSEKKTCYEAGVPADYCPCFSELSIPLTDAREPAEKLLTYVNELLQDTKKEYSAGFKCSPLTIADVTFGSVKLPPARLVVDKQTQRTVASKIELQYRVAFSAHAPSLAQIEGVVIRDMDSGEWRVTGEIERNNKYGNTSHCVVDRVLKKICHCLKA